MRIALPTAVLLTLCCSASSRITTAPPHDPAKASEASILADIPRDATALCVDNTWSPSKKRSGACSSQGGIKAWFGKPPEGATTRCIDGTCSKSTGQGTCSSHGGVAYPLKEPKQQS